jgi:cytochrome c-type biogenesis protein CcmE
MRTFPWVASQPTFLFGHVSGIRPSAQVVLLCIGPPVPRVDRRSIAALPVLIEFQKAMERADPPKTKNLRRIRLIVGLTVIVAAAGVLLWLGIGRGTVYYYSVAELLAKGDAERVRVSGELEGGSLAEDGQGGFTFTVYDRDRPAERLTVVYDGALPDSFQDEPGSEVVAEGDYGGGTFRAETLISKCPSKYEAAP